MDSCISIGNFEKKIVNFFNEISPIPLNEYHQLIRDYSKIWEAIRDKRLDEEEVKVFLGRINEIPLSYQCADTLLTEEGKTFMHFGQDLMNKLPLYIYLSRKEKDNQFVCSPLFTIFDFDEYLIPSILCNKEKKYLFGFSNHKTTDPFGIPFGDEIIEDKYFHDTQSACYTISFPQESPFERALISASKHNGKYLLEKVIVKLDSELND